MSQTLTTKFRPIFVFFVFFLSLYSIPAFATWTPSQDGSYYYFIQNGSVVKPSGGKTYECVGDPSTSKGWWIDSEGKWYDNPPNNQPCTIGEEYKDPSTSSTSTTSSSSNDGCVETTLFGKVCQDDRGIFKILGLIILILTYGIGIAATIGFVLSGYQYITAGDNQGQIVKAKTRIFHIVIGLIVYAVLFSLLNFFIPGGIQGF